MGDVGLDDIGGLQLEELTVFEGRVHAFAGGDGDA